MHIVHFVKSDQLPACGAGGCPVVLGVMVALTTNESEVSPELRRVVEAMPLDEGSATIAGELNVNALLPEDRTFFTYEGSLTTPPCTYARGPFSPPACCAAAGCAVLIQLGRVPAAL
jgi:carbonic anhydrase